MPEGEPTFEQFSPKAKAEIEEILEKNEQEQAEEPLQLEPETANLLKEDFSWLAEKPRELLGLAASLQDRRFHELRNEVLSGEQHNLEAKDLSEFFKVLEYLRSRYRSFYEDPNNVYLQEIEKTMDDSKVELQAAAETQGWSTEKAWALLDMRVSSFTNRAILKSLPSFQEVQTYRQALQVFLQQRNLELSGIQALRAERARGQAQAS